MRFARTGPLALAAAGALAVAAPTLAANETYNKLETRESEPQRIVVEGYEADQVAVVFPRPLFDEAREIIDTVKAYYDADVVEDSGQAVSEEMINSIRAGEALPEGLDPQPIPEDLASQLPGTGEWVSVGETLVALDDGGSVQAIYYEMLPLNP